jgi:hypothetical protein
LSGQILFECNSPHLSIKKFLKYLVFEMASRGLVVEPLWATETNESYIPKEKELILKNGAGQHISSVVVIVVAVVARHLEVIILKTQNQKMHTPPHLLYTYLATVGYGLDSRGGRI